MNRTLSESEVDCNVCGLVGADQTVTVGTQRGESGTMGLELCHNCWEAARWHSKNTERSRCVNCAEPQSKLLTLYKPTRPESEPILVEVNMCRECHSEAGGVIQAYESDVGFRAISNVALEWEGQRHTALERDGFTCQSCGTGDCRLHVHHQVPRSDGGTDHIDNLVTLCPDCHAEKHDQNACLLCGGLDDVRPATWLDTSGGGMGHFCEDCQDYIERGGGGERCAICARFSKSSRSDGLYFQGGVEAGSKPPIYAACDECRKKILFGSWHKRQQYVDEKLPDSHVNVRHWEGDS